MTMRSTLLGLVFWLIGSAGLLAAVTGTVVSSEGTPIEHARVELAGGAGVAFTDVEGSFRLEVEPAAGDRRHPSPIPFSVGDCRGRR